MSVGFRPTEADNEIIQGHKRPGETTSDVLRRALRALDREKWKAQALADMERIAAVGEDLSDEPDDWGYDENGRVVDLRGEPDERPSMAAAAQAAASAPAESLPAWPQGFLDAPPLPSLERVRALAVTPKAVTDAIRATQQIANIGQAMTSIHWIRASNAFEAKSLVGEEWIERKTPEAEQSSPAPAVQVVGAGPVVKIVDERSAVADSPARRAGAPWKLAHLRTIAARRGSKR
jgi:hypothetical protein